MGNLFGFLRGSRMVFCECPCPNSKRNSHLSLRGRGVESAGAGQALPARASARRKFCFWVKSSSEPHFLIFRCSETTMSKSVSMSMAMTLGMSVRAAAGGGWGGLEEHNLNK